VLRGTKNKIESQWNKQEKPAFFQPIRRKAAIFAALGADCTLLLHVLICSKQTKVFFSFKVFVYQTILCSHVEHIFWNLGRL